MLEPNPCALEPQQHFEQRLSLEDGYVQIKGGYDAIVTLWVDVGLLSWSSALNSCPN